MDDWWAWLRSVLCGQEASIALQPAGPVQGLWDPSLAAPSRRCQGELCHRALQGHAWKGAARHNKRGLGCGEQCFILSPRGCALVPAAPGAAHAAFEHLQCEYQLLARHPGVWAGQYQLLLVGAKWVAAAAEGVYLLGVCVEAVKNPPQREWVRAVALRGLTSPQPLQRRADPGGVCRA